MLAESERRSPYEAQRRRACNVFAARIGNELKWDFKKPD